MALKAKFSGKHTKVNPITGKAFPVFRFKVSGSTEELQQFETAQGDNYRIDEDTQEPLWFTTRYISDNVELIITDNNRVIADDSELSKLQSLVETYGESVARLMLMQKS